MVDFALLINKLLPSTSSMICYRQDHLVWYPTQKCASSTYRQLFEKLQWTKIDISAIDWNNDQVFAHIREPLTRHRKGIVEGICNYYPQEIKNLFLRDPIAVQFLSHVTIVESHSYTIEKWLGHERSALVYWIPIDTSIDHVRCTMNLLEKFDKPLDKETEKWFLNLPRQNVCSPEELDLYESLIKYETPAEILRYIDFDRCLYELITTYHGFEPNNYQSRIAMLKSQGLSQAESESIADREVADGSYLSWQFERK